MPDKPAAERTEQPTQKKLQKSREKGQVAQSEELGAAVAVVVLLMMLSIYGPTMLQWFCGQVQQGIDVSPTIFSDSKSFSGYFNKKIVSSISIMAPVMGSLVVAGVLTGIAVGGLNFAPQALMWKLDAINPIKGVEKLLNVKSLVKLGISVLKLIIISIIVWVYLRNRIEELAAIRWAWSMQIMVTISKIIFGALVRICIALLVIASIDVIFQKWKHINELKMTKEEVRKEHKETDGSPEVKSRIRGIQIAMAKQRMLQEIPSADVVIVNPTHYAVVLKYDPKTMDSPIMVAKGADHLAAKIREIAQAYGVPIIRKPELTRTIYKTVKVGGDVPGTLYTAVAEVLAMIYRLRNAKR